MKIKLLITLENGNVATQQILSEWKIEKEKGEFFIKLQSYMNSYIIEHNRKNLIKIATLEAFDESDNLLMTFGKN